MTILNVDEIERCGITEQPIEYNSEYELINWLKYDLLQQARRNGKEPDKNNIITITDEEEKEYTLHIGIEDYKNNIKNKTIIDFDFKNFIYLLYTFIIKYKTTDELHYNIRLDNLIINNELRFCNNFFKIFDCKMQFYNIEFIKAVWFDTLILSKRIYFGGCCFKDRLYFFCSKMDRKIWISNSIFENGISFANNHIDSIEITKSYLNKELKLKSNKIKKIISINKINIFNSKDIKEKNYNAKIKLDNIIFYDDTSFINLNNLKKVNEININNTFINGRINLKNIEVKEADFQGSVINGGLINSVNFKVHKFANRESALFLKNEAYARNNAIDALQYKAKEIEKHKEDLIKDWQKNKDFKTFGDIVSIGLSSLYSDNGQNWIRALFMTIAITVICFIVFYIPDLTQSNIIRLYYKNLFPELIKYFIPTDYTLLIKYAESNLHLLLKIFGVLVYFLGKVLFWYGSVQTVTAFRKFAKGA